MKGWIQIVERVEPDGREGGARWMRWWSQMVERVEPDG